MSHREKLERARTHGKAFTDILQAFADSKPYTQIREDRVDPSNRRFGEVIWHFKKRAELPPELPLIVGDAIYNMRSALDHLAHSLAWEFTRERLKPERVLFPLHSAIGSYLDRGVDAVRQMSPAVQGIIEKMQPYHGWHGTEEHPLGVLNKLSNIDKHRHLVLGSVVSTQSSADIAFTKDCVAVTSGTPQIRVGPFDDQTDVVTVLVEITGPDPQVTVDTNVQFDVAFPESGPAPGKIVIDELARIYEHIRDDVFPILEREL